MQRIISPYTAPATMISTTAPPIAPGTAAAAPAVSTADLIAQAYIDKQRMVSASPDSFSQSWIAYRARQSPDSDPRAPRIDTNHLPRETGPADPEDITRAMFLIREAETSRQAGDIAQAIVYYEQALERFPRMNQANREVGRLHLAQGNYAEAITHLGAALIGTEDPGGVYLDLGSACLYAGRTTEALGHFQAGRRADPDNPDMQFNEGLALRLLNRNVEARAVLLGYRDAHEDDPRVYRELALLDLAVTNQAGALAYLEQAAQRDPAWYTPLIDMALVHAQAGRAEEALGRLAEALDKAPAWVINRAYQQPAFGDIRLMPESKPFEARLADRLRREMQR